MITKSRCNHCKEIIKTKDWIQTGGRVIMCPKCHEEIMDICFTTPVKGGCDCCAHKFKEKRNERNTNVV